MKISNGNAIATIVSALIFCLAGPVLAGFSERSSFLKGSSIRSLGPGTSSIRPSRIRVMRSLMDTPRAMAEATTSSSGNEDRTIVPLLTDHVDRIIAESRQPTAAPENDPSRPLFDKASTPDALAASAAPTPVPAEMELTGLAKEFSESLLTYHRVDGRKDGSAQTGVQYPPVPEVHKDDVAGLKAFIARLSVFLGSQPVIDYKPSPATGPERTAFRKQLAREAADNIKANARQQFLATVDTMKTEKVRLFVKKALAAAQPEFFRAPSSSSGKFHPADEINLGGLLVHTIRNVVVGRLLAQFFNLPPQRHDFITAGLILHDIDKGGIPWKHNSKPGDAPDSGYDPAHGPVAADWLKQFEAECGPDCDSIIEDVRDHMAQWNKPGPTPPWNLEEQIVSYADYLASHDSVYVSWRPSAAH